MLPTDATFDRQPVTIWNQFGGPEIHADVLIQRDTNPPAAFLRDDQHLTRGFGNIILFPAGVHWFVLRYCEQCSLSGSPPNTYSPAWVNTFRTIPEDDSSVFRELEAAWASCKT